MPSVIKKVHSLTVALYALSLKKVHSVQGSWFLLQDLWKFVARVVFCGFSGRLYYWPRCVFGLFFILFEVFVATFDLAGLGSVSVFVSSRVQEIVLKKLKEVVVLWLVVHLLRPSLDFVDYIFQGIFDESLEEHICFDLVVKSFE